MSDIRIRVLLELDPLAEPISGLLCVDGERRPFSGWLALARELDAALAAARPQPRPKAPAGEDATR